MAEEKQTKPEGQKGIPPHLAKQQKQAEEIKYLVRVFNTDLDGRKQIHRAIQKITGIGPSLSNAILSVAKVQKSKKAGNLTDQEIRTIEDVIHNPTAYDIPLYLLNRRHDPETGEDKHLYQAELKFQTQNDIKLMQKLKSYKGIRHMTGLTVRGQRTKANFRKNKGKGMGVMKKAPAPAKK